MFDIISAIGTKKKGRQLNAGDWTEFVREFGAQTIPDYQASALMMAVCLRGMSDDETVELTEALWHSGESLDFGDLGRPLVDKHSTGGVGDKVTPVLVPLLVACGCAICKMSGRGLGHTGGTVDKLSSIPGFRTALTKDELGRQMHNLHGAMIGQSGLLAPADKKLYALRDVTDTVDSVPLITASIMSKKLAGGADVICLDVKTGDGALFGSDDEAREFARLVMLIGDRYGKRVCTVFSPMDSPLGRAVGNALEIREVIDVLEGKSVEEYADLIDVVLELGSEILFAAGLAHDKEQACGILRTKLANREALTMFESIVTAQGGSVEAFKKSFSELDNRVRIEIESPESGRISKICAKPVGEIVRSIGAGRYQLEDEIDPFTGILLLKKPLDSIETGEPWAQCYFDPANAILKRQFEGRSIEQIAKILKSRLNETLETRH